MNLRPIKQSDIFYFEHSQILKCLLLKIKNENVPLRTLSEFDDKRLMKPFLISTEPLIIMIFSSKHTNLCFILHHYDWDSPEILFLITFSSGDQHIYSLFLFCSLARTPWRMDTLVILFMEWILDKLKVYFLTLLNVKKVNWGQNVMYLMKLWEFENENWIIV